MVTINKIPILEVGVFSKLNIYKVFYLAVLFLVLLVATVEAVKGDKRVTKTLTLENGLAVFLVSDPDVHRSAAALSVGVGHL